MYEKYTPVRGRFVSLSDTKYRRQEYVFDLANSCVRAALNSYSLIRSVLRHDGRLFGAWRRNRRRPGECRAELTKYAAARPLFALGAGRMAASGIICRGVFLGSDVGGTRAPKVPPKIVGPLRGNDFWGNPQEGVVVFPGLGALRRIESA